MTTISKSALQAVAAFASKDSTRHNLHAVSLDKGQGVIVATDGQAMAWCNVQGLNTEGILSIKDLSPAIRAMGPLDSLVLDNGTSRTSNGFPVPIEHGEVFPEWMRALPNGEPKVTISISLRLLETMVRSARKLVNKYGRVDLEIFGPAKGMGFSVHDDLGTSGGKIFNPDPSLAGVLMPIVEK